MQASMLDPRLVLLVLCLYMGFLVLVAVVVERRSAVGRSPANNPWVYSLSLAVYCTAWTYYGSVGKAATSGMLFLPIYLGPTLSLFLWWILLRKLVRLKASYRITSIADFISVRYNRSQPLAALATLIALVGVLPYIALQLKAIITTFAIISKPVLAASSFNAGATLWLVDNVGLMVVVLVTAFTIVLGVRRLAPTERHEGMVAALAVECVVKLVAFLMAGVFVTYFMYNGFGDIFSRLTADSLADIALLGGTQVAGYSTWASYFLLSMSAILFLPRQFHVAVVENFNEKHILTAMWLFPLYMLLINIFVLPIALAGLLHGYAPGDADKYVLLLPLRHAAGWLPLLVFIGGFSAAAGMIMITSMTMATMMTNHLLLPLVEWFRSLDFLKRHLLRCRWAAVTVLIAAGYWFEKRIFQPYMLVNIGLISFAAVLQFAPPILGGVFWRRGNKAGALLGLASGFAVWSYTQLLPSFVRNGWLSYQLLDRGPWGIALLKPEKLFGIVDLDPLSHTVIWSMFFNIGCYVAGSLYFESSPEERSFAAEFVGSSLLPSPLQPGREREAYIDLAVKRKAFEKLFRQYFPAAEANSIMAQCLEEAAISGEDSLTIVQLAELHSAVERTLAGSIGSAAAHRALQQSMQLTSRERRDLSEVYAEILDNLKVTPRQLISDISKLKALEREKANLVSMFAHDMRSSLTGIHGLGLRLFTKGDSIGTDKRLEYLKIINREAAKLESLVDDFLEFSRLETGRLRLNFTHVALDRELVELFETYQVRAAQKELQLQLQMQPALPVIRADANRLRRVFTNLLDNALKFSGTGSTITIVCRESEEEICVSIRDQGVGIAPQDLPYIFDLFHRGGQDAQRDGYGIGLATVKAIVEGHQGRVMVESRPGQGSIFSVCLPKPEKPP